MTPSQAIDFIAQAIGRLSQMFASVWANGFDLSSPAVRTLAVITAISAVVILFVRDR
jgi:hypothetical protein